MLMHRAGVFLAFVLGAGPLAAAAAEGPATTQSSGPLTARAMGLLRDNCFTCHNPEKKKGGLSLSSRSAALAGGDDGAVLDPGNSAGSKLAGALDAAADPH